MSRAACADAAGALAALARPGGPTLFRAQVLGSWEGDAGLTRVVKVVEFGGDGDAAAASDAGDAHQKRSRDPAEVDATPAPRSQRLAAPKLAEVRGGDVVTESTAIGGEADEQSGNCNGSDDSDGDDIPDVVFESADEDE